MVMVFASRASLLCFTVGAVTAAETAILGKLEAVRIVLLVLLGVVITTLALLASHHDHHPILFFRHLVSWFRERDIKNTDTRPVPTRIIA